jgi:CRP-like cAMP-binding protein
MRPVSAKATNPLQADILGLGQQSLERRSLARNEVLFRQGDKVTAIYFVEAGRLRLDRRTFAELLDSDLTIPAGLHFWFNDDINIRQNMEK